MLVHIDSRRRTVQLTGLGPAAELVMQRGNETAMRQRKPSCQMSEYLQVVGMFLPDGPGAHRAPRSDISGTILEGSWELRKLVHLPNHLVVARTGNWTEWIPLLAAPTSSPDSFSIQALAPEGIT